MSSLAMFIVLCLLNRTILNNIGMISRIMIDITVGIAVYLLGLTVLKDDFFIKNIKKIKLRNF